MLMDRKGSTHCLIFRPGVKLLWNDEWFTQEEPFLKDNPKQKNIPVKSLLAVVQKK